MAQRRVVRRVARAPGRKFVWARSEISVTIAGSATDRRNLFEDFQTEYGAQLLGSTVMRIRGHLRIAPVATASFCTVAGVIVAPDSAAVGNPLTDARHADWMAYEPLCIGNGGPQFFDWEIDVKSHRKVEELGETLWLVIHNPLAATAVDYDAIVSVGVKLP